MEKKLSIDVLTLPRRGLILDATHSTKGFDMKSWKLGASAIVLALMAVTPARADVTPEEVWQTWQDFMSSGGATVTTGSVARDGDTLVITDLKTSYARDGSTGESAIGEIRLRDKGDGTVELTLSEESSFTSSSPAIDGGKAVGANGTMKMPGLVGTVSGTAEDMAYAFDMPSVDVAIEPTEDGQPAGKIGLLVSGGTSTYQLTGPAGAKLLDGTFAASSAAMTLEVTDDETDVLGSFNVADLTGTLKSNSTGLEEEDLAVALSKGFSVDMGVELGAMNYDFDITDADGPAKLVGGSQGGSFQLAMDAARMVLAGSGKAVEVTFSGAQLPFPEVKLSYAESAFNLTMPLSKSDEAKDFAFLTKIVDLQVSEDIWAMFDPTSVLPHDPATVVIDTTGQVRLKADLMATTEGAQPDGELLALNVNDVTARFAGAELTGKGAFTFDNTDLETYGGMPAPTGTLDMTLTGGNGLLDKLVALGFVPEDQAMGARMMIAMFAKVGEGEDVLTSTLEFKDKHFYANGQQLQ